MLKEKYAAYKVADDAYKKLLKDLKSKTSVLPKVEAYKKKLDDYNKFVTLADHEKEAGSYDPAVQMIIDLKTAELKHDEEAIPDLSDAQKKVLTNLNTARSNYFLYR